jgi:type I restriction enzyme S subunit
LGGWALADHLKLFQLGDVTENHDGRRVPVKGADRKPGPYPYYGASGVVDFVADYIFDGEYLLIAEDGENLRTRKTPIAFMASGRFWVNNHAHIVRGNGQADTRFLCYYLSHADVSGYLTGSTMPKLTQGAMNRIPVWLPPLDEQRRIAAILGALDDKIELNRKMNRTLEEMAQAIFKSWFIDFDGHDDLVDSEIGPVPRGWEVLPFFQGATDFGSVFPTNRVYCNAPTRFAEEWDVLTSVRAPVGRTNVAISRCAIGRGVASIRSREGRYPTYVWCLIGSLSAALDVYNGEGTVFGSINKKALHVLPVVVPPIAKVAAFEEVSWPVLQHLRVTEEESRTLTDPPRHPPPQAHLG